MIESGFCTACYPPPFQLDRKKQHITCCVASWNTLHGFYAVFDHLSIIICIQITVIIFSAYKIVLNLIVATLLKIKVLKMYFFFAAIP